MSDQYPTTPQPGEPGGYNPPPASEPPADPYAGQGGAYPPPPPPPPYDPNFAPATGPQPLSPGAAFSYAWTKFTQNVGPLIVVVLAAAAAFAVLYGVGIVIAGAIGGGSAYGGYGSYGYSFGGVGMVVLYLFMALGLIAEMIIALGLVRAALDITAGRPVTFGSVFNFSDLGGALVTAIVVGLATAVGSMLCYVPGIIVAFLTMFALMFSMDKKMSAMDSIKASFELIKANMTPAILVWLVAAAAVFVGSLLCGIGALVAYPVAMIMIAYAYRYLQGEPIAP